MKAQFLKMAGVKTEAAFYKKYPNEAAFFKAHPQAKKMVNGGKQDKGQLKKLDQLLDFGNPPKAQFGKLAPITNNVSAAQPFQSKFTGNITDLALPKNLPSAGGMSKLGPAAGYIQPAMDLIEGISMIGDQRTALDEAEQNAKLTGVQAQAATLRPQPINRRYTRPEDVMIQPEQMFPTYGVGTNVLAEYGATVGGNPGEIQNTYAPNDLYDDLGYEPLSDSNKLKSYQLGGNIGGGFGDFMDQGGGNLLNNLTSLTQRRRGPSAGNQIGKGIGSAAGTALFGPVGGMVGGALGNVVGGLFDNTGRKLDAFENEADANLNSVIGQQFGQGIQTQYNNFMEDGGYVSHDWTPQLITKFGEHNLKDLLQPPHDADMLRAGGHLKEYTPPSASAMYTGRAEYGAQMAMGGDLKVYRGEAESVSNNPYLPDGGETIMFRGPSHDNGGMPISFGQSPVEVEGGEPAVKLKDGGTGEDNLVVFGNLKIPNQFLSEIGDDKAKGKKFKNYVHDLSKIEARQNKIIDKSVNTLDDLDVKTSFDKLKMSALEANILGGNMKLKDIADKKQSAAAVQSAINDTAEEYSLVADDLARGKIKMDKSKTGMAKYGADLPKAQGGEKVNNSVEGLLELLDKKGYSHSVTSKLRPGAKTAQGRPSRHASGEAVDVVFPTLGKNAYKTLLQDPEVAKFMLDNNLTAIDEYDPKTLAATKGTGPHIHFGLDKGTAASDKFRKEASALYAEPTVNDEYGLTPWTGNKAKGSKYGKKTASSFTLDEWNKVAQNLGFKGKGNKEFQEFLLKDPRSAELIKARHKELYGTEPFIDDRLGYGYAAKELMNLQENPINAGTLPQVTISGKSPKVTTLEPTEDKFPWMQVANQLIPYLRPTDAERLDPNQLMGEMYALSTNELEPVQAQTYQPQLSTPQDISYQDALNANQADFNAMLRQSRYVPEAQAALSAQKYAANQKVLADQFRANQAEKQRVYEGNRNVLNDAQLKNLQILDQQYGRQAQARSNTKATAQAALNSISSKIAQNRLDNRTLSTMENLYNYRFDPSFRARNMNPLVDFDQMIANASPTDLDKIKKSLEEKTTKTKSEKTARNGSIVKAIKNL
jgi:hypothetical protein